MSIPTRHFDTLESRRLLSAVLHGDVLFIRGSQNVDNTVGVAFDSTGDKIQVTVNTDTPALFDQFVPCIRLGKILWRAKYGL